jgi:hypothetical protein
MCYKCAPMTISTKEERVPGEFPPARLFIDDLEEIVRIFEAAVQGVQARDSAGALPKVKIVFSIGDQECDDIKDLPRIAPETSRLKIFASAGSWQNASLDCSQYSTRWSSTGFTDEQKWSAFRKLQPVFKRRNLRWRTFFQANQTLVGAISVLTAFAVCTGVLFIFSKRPVTGALLFFFGLLFGISVSRAGSRNTTVAFCQSSEPSHFLPYFKEKIIPPVVGGLIGIGGTILALYLRHAYWP